MNAGTANSNALATKSEREIWALLESLPDPEIPVVSLIDLGIIRDVKVSAAETCVSVAPTYSGCPATEVIQESILGLLARAGIDNARVVQVLTPPWSTDWITDSGREKLRAYGIAPPEQAGSSKRSLFGHTVKVSCPRCNSDSTTKVSEFGSTPCKASYKCSTCLEPFEYFKCI